MNFIEHIGAARDRPEVRQILGGKGYALDMMFKNGFPVPRGLIITTLAFDRFMAANDFPDFDRIIGGGLPADLSAEFKEEFYGLPFEYSAVRSSADREDSPGKSFAGQFDSFLAVGKPGLDFAVKRCWASRGGSRARVYLPEKNKTGKMAVVVQEMIDADVSGVSFSVNPVDGGDSVVIEAILGNNEALVQGTVTPDHYEINRRLEITEKQVIRQKQRLVVDFDQGGMKSIDIDRLEQKINDDRIVAVAKMVKSAATFFKTDVDVEWAFKGDELYMLQCRPITALPQ